MTQRESEQVMREKAFQAWGQTPGTDKGEGWRGVRNRTVPAALEGQGRAGSGKRPERPVRPGGLFLLAEGATGVLWS